MSEERKERIADRLLEQVTQEEYDSGVKVIVLVRDGDSGAASAGGYPHDEDMTGRVMSDMLGAAGMLAEAAGIGFSVLPIPSGGGQG